MASNPAIKTTLYQLAVRLFVTYLLLYGFQLAGLFHASSIFRLDLLLFSAFVLTIPLLTLDINTIIPNNSVFVSVVVIMVLLITLVFGGTSLVKSDLGHQLFKERNISHAQKACVDFDTKNSADYGCSTNGVPVTPHGNPQTTNGRYGQGVFFDGTDDYLDSEIAYDSGNFTESIWIYSENSSWGRSTLDWPGRWITKHEDLYGGFFVLKRNQGAEAGYRLITEEEQKVTFTPVDIDTGNWIHLVVVYNENTRRFMVYANGEFVDYIELQAKPKSWNGLKFGGGSSYWLSGKVDDYRMYDAALTSEQVAALYKGQESYFPILYSKKLDIGYIFICTVLSVGVLLREVSNEL